MTSRSRSRSRARGLACVVALALHGCTSPEPAPGEDDHHARVGPNSAGSAFATVSSAADAALLEAPARVVLPSDAAAEIAATYRLHVDRVHVRPGDTVAVGDVLVEGKAPELLDAAASLRAAQAHAKILQARRDRLVKLREEGLVEQSRVFDLDVAIAEVEGQRLRATAALRAGGYGPGEAAQLSRQGKVTLTSPIAGIVREVDAVVGQVREPSAGAMVSIVGTGPPRIEARLTGPVPAGARFELVLRGDQVIDLGEAPPTTVVVPEDGTILAWWDPPAQDLRLAPGLLGRVRARAVDPTLLQVPAAALRVTDGSASVLRAHPDGRLEPVPVEVVVSSGASALVRGALSVGEKVAADASEVLRAPEGGGHAH